MHICLIFGFRAHMCFVCIFGMQAWPLASGLIGRVHINFTAYWPTGNWSPIGLFSALGHACVCTCWCVCIYILYIRVIPFVLVFVTRTSITSTSTSASRTTKRLTSDSALRFEPRHACCELLLGLVLELYKGRVHPPPPIATCIVHVPHILRAKT